MKNYLNEIRNEKLTLSITVNLVKIYNRNIFTVREYNKTMISLSMLTRFYRNTYIPNEYFVVLLGLTEYINIVLWECQILRMFLQKKKS